MSTTRAASSAKASKNSAKEKKKAGVFSSVPSTGKILKFALLPEFGRSFKGIRTSFDLLINLVAQIFAMAKLIPVDHPCVNLKNASDYKLSQVIGIAYKNVVWSKKTIPQIVMFYAIIAFLIFMTLSFIVFLLQLTMGVAHAALPVDPNDTKIVNDYLLKTLFNFTGDGLVPKALGQLLGYYSKVMLVLAGIILIFIVISTVMESAQSGTPFGRNFNHTWAPIRIIVAIGLLIPLNGGLNSGQYIVLNLVKWGSDQATLAWGTFSNYMDIANMGPNDVSVSNARETVMDIAEMELCAARTNDHYEDYGLNKGIKITTNNPAPTGIVPTGNPFSADFQTNRKTVFTTVNYAGSTLGNVKSCGSISFPHLASADLFALGDPKSTTPLGTQAVTTSDYQDYLMQARYALYLKARSQIKDVMVKWDCSTDTQKVGRPGCTSVPKFALSKDFNRIINSYTDTQRQYAKNALTRLKTQIGTNLSTSTQKAGWLTAPVYLYKISQLYSALQTEAAKMPVFTTPNSGEPQLLASLSTLGQDVNPAISTSADDGTGEWLSNAGANMSGNGLTTMLNNSNSAIGMINPVAGIAAGAVSSVVSGNGLVNSYGGGVAQAAGGGALYAAGLAKTGMDDLLSSYAEKIGCANGKTCLENFQIHSNNPIVEIAVIGQKIFTWGITAIETGFALSMGGAIPVIGGAGAAVGGLMLLIGGSFLLSGFLLGFLVPLTPVLRFFAGVLGWMMLTLQACFAIPLIALAHLSTKGEGFMGDSKSAYINLLGIVIRPILIILGLIAGLMVFNIIIQVFSNLFMPAVSATFNMSDSNIFHALAIVFIYAFFCFAMCETSFKMIDIIPDQVMSWIGGNLGRQGTEDDVDAVARDAKQGFAGFLLKSNDVVKPAAEIGRTVTGTVSTIAKLPVND